MNPGLHIEEVTTEEEMKEAQAFAQSFDHEITESPWPLFMVTKDGQPKGYFYIANPVLIWPALSHECSPRETKEIIEMVKRRANLCGNPAAVVPKDSPTFTPEVMQKLGFTPTNLLLYTL